MLLLTYGCYIAAILGGPFECLGCLFQDDITIELSKLVRRKSELRGEQFNQ